MSTFILIYCAAFVATYVCFPLLHHIADLGNYPCPHGGERFFLSLLWPIVVPLCIIAALSPSPADDVDSTVTDDGDDNDTGNAA